MAPGSHSFSFFSRVRHSDAFNEHLSCLCFNLLFEKVIVWGAEARLTEFESYSATYYLCDLGQGN